MFVTIEKWPFNRNYYLTNKQIISALNSWNEPKEKKIMIAPHFRSRCMCDPISWERQRQIKETPTPNRYQNSFQHICLALSSFRSTRSNRSFSRMQEIPKEMAKVRWKMSTRCGILCDKVTKLPCMQRSNRRNTKTQLEKKEKKKRLGLAF